MYYIMSRKVDMKLILGQQRRTMSNMVPQKPIVVSTNTILQTQLSSLNGNVFKGNMNSVFAARGRPCG
jgi:hypothetical protein